LVALDVSTKASANSGASCSVEPFAFKGFGAVAPDLRDIADEFPHLLRCGIHVHGDFIAQFHKAIVRPTLSERSGSSRHIGELCVVIEERKADHAGGPVAVLADEDFRRASIG